MPSDRTLSAPLECSYLDPHEHDDGCHTPATWAILTPGARPADATYVCAAHLAELCEDGDTVRRVGGEVARSNYERTDR